MPLRAPLHSTWRSTRSTHTPSDQSHHNEPVPLFPTDTLLVVLFCARNALFAGKRLLVTLGISQMLVVIGREIMVARKIFLGAHIQKVAGLVIEHRINGGNLRHVDGAGRQASVFIRVVRRFYFLRSEERRVGKKCRSRWS